MKKFFNLLTMAAFLTTMLVGCSKSDSPESIQDVVSNEKVVTFNAVPAKPETKTVFGDKNGSSYPTVWTNTEGVYVSLNFAPGKKADVTPLSGGIRASFKATFADDDKSGDYVFYAISPYSMVKGAYSGGTTRAENDFTVDFPASQSPTLASVEETAHIMAAKSVTYTTFPDPEVAPVEFQFSHIAAYGKFSLKNFPETVTIQSVDIDAGESIAGRTWFFPETGVISVRTGSNIISIDASKIDPSGSLTSNSDYVFWFSMIPTNLEGKTVKFTVHTDAGDYVKNVTFPSGKGNFQKGRVASFNLDMDGITPAAPTTYTLVTSYSELLAGSQIILVSSTEEYAMSSTQNTNNRGAVGITKSESSTKIVGPSDAVEVFTLEAGSVTNTVSFKATKTEGYIYAASSGSNYLRTQANKDDNASFSVNLESGAIVAQGTNTRNTMRYNASNTSFACYSSTSTTGTTMAIYKVEGTGSGKKLIEQVTPDPVIEFNAATNTVTITCSDATARIGYTLDGTDPGIDEYGNPDGSTEEYTGPFTITATCTVKAFAGAEHCLSSNIVSKLCTVSTGSRHFVKVTTAPTDFSGTYLLVFEKEGDNKIFDGSLTAPDASVNYLTVTSLPTEGFAESSYSGYAVTIETYSTGYSVKNAAGVYIGRSANSNGIDGNTTLGANFVNTITMDTNGHVIITGKGGRAFNWNAASGKFRYFAATNTASVYLYKLQ